MGHATLHVHSKELVVVPVNEVDSTGIDRFRSQIMNAVARDPHRLVVEASDLKFICSEGLGVLVVAMLEQRDAGREMCIRNPSPMLRDVLARTRLDVVLMICG